MGSVVNHLWQSTLFAGVVGLLTLTLRSNRASTRFWVWLAASAKFLVPIAALVAVGRQFPLSWLTRAPEPAAAVLVAALFPSSASRTLAVHYEWLLLSAWLLGAMTVFVRWSWQWRWLSTLERNATPITAGREHEILRRIERAIGLAQQIRLASTTSAIEPGVIGIRKPVLLWPSQMSVQLSDAQIETIIAHEVFHVRRRDNLFASFHMFITAVFWFHPVLWWLGARLVEERELACDEHVLALGNHPETYAQSIVKTCEFSIASPLVNVAGVTGADLKKRILRIMRNEPAMPLQFWKKAGLAVGALVAILLPLVLGVFVRAETPASVETPPAARQEDYRPGNGIETPKLVREVKPQYTARAMEAKVQGSVLMECVVEPDGSVGRITVLQSLDPDLDQQAIEALQQWLFEPGRREGEPVPVIVVIQMSFTLK